MSFRSDVSTISISPASSALLGILHSINAEEAARNGVPTYACTPDESLAETMSMSATVYPNLPDDLKPLCRPYLDGTCTLPAGPTPAMALVHADLVDEHVLLNDAGRVTGVIDWGDSALSDPTIDFGGLYAWLGEEFVRDTLEHYSPPRDSSFLARIAFRARCAALTSYGHALAGRDTSRADRLQMVRTAFGVEVANMREPERR